MYGSVHSMHESYQLPDYFIAVIKDIIKFESISLAMFVKRAMMSYIRDLDKLNYGFNYDKHFRKFPRTSGFLSLTTQEYREFSSFKDSMREEAPLTKMTTTVVACTALWNTIPEIREFFEQIMREGCGPHTKTPVKHIIIEKDPKDWS